MNLLVELEKLPSEDQSEVLENNERNAFTKYFF